jgi:uncharacterized protein with PIN domain
MTREDIIRMARECFADPDGSLELLTPELTEFAALIAAAQREKLAHWMRSMGYATGHGDTIEEMLDHLGTQIAERLKAEVLMERKQYEHTLALQKASYEREIKIEVEAEREACADICDGITYHYGKEADRCAAAIRARSKT